MRMLIPAPRLKFALRLDAIASLLCGIAALLWLHALQTSVGASHGATLSIALVMVVYGSALGWLSTQPRIAHALVGFIASGNLAWTLASLALMVSDWIDPNQAGMAVLLGQAIATAVFSTLQFQGLRRSENART